MVKVFTMSILFILMFAFAIPVCALVPRNHVVMLTAEVQEELPGITLKWAVPITTVSGYTIYKKDKSDIEWGAEIAKLGSNVFSYLDEDVEVGKEYEYKVETVNGVGFIFAGIKVPVSEQELLRRYLNKDHNYRHGKLEARRMAFIEDGFQERYGEAMSQNGWRNFSPLLIESWPLCDEDAHWSRKQVDWEDNNLEFRRQYFALNKSFNPIRFQPDIWADLAVVR